MENIRTTIVRLFSPLAHLRILIRLSFIIVKSEGPEAAELDHKSDKSLRSWWDRRRGRGDIERECGGTSSESGEDEKNPKKPLKRSPRVQSGIYAVLRASSFDITHTINIILIGMWASSR